MTAALNKIALERPYLAFQALSFYNSQQAFGLGPDRILDKNYFWAIHRKDDSGSYGLDVVLTKALDENVTVTWSFSGSAVEDTDFSCSESSLTIRPGNLVATIPIQIISKGKWFKEKDIIVTLNASSNTILAKDQHKARIVIVPATEPPTISVSATESTFSSNPSGTPDNSVTITWTASYAPLEDITLRYKITGDASDGVSFQSGSTTLAAGSTSTATSFQYSGSHAAGSTFAISADYERNTVAFTELDWEPIQGGFTVPRDVHVDENMWPQSQNLVADGFDQTVTRSPDKPWWPGYPTSWGIDGSVESNDPSLTGYKVDIIEQSASPAITDPVTGDPLKWFVPNDHITALVPYLRNAFSLTWPGGRSTAHVLKAYTRAAFRIIPMDSADIDHQAEFFEISQRVRTQDLNHVAKFRWKDVGSPGFGTGTPGLASNGETVPVYTPPGYPNIRIWLWSLINPHPAAVSSGWAGGWGTWYGAFEDEHGLGVYMIHRLDPAVDWNGKTETPGVDKGNHILWPVGLDEGLASVKANQTGMLWHSMQTQMSDTALTGPPTDFWPGLGTVWTPWGNAVIDPAATTSLTFTKV